MKIGHEDRDRVLSDGTFAFAITPAQGLDPDPTHAELDSELSDRFNNLKIGQYYPIANSKFNVR